MVENLNTLHLYYGFVTIWWIIMISCLIFGQGATKIIIF